MLIRQILENKKSVAEGLSKQFEIIYLDQSGERKRKIVSGTSKEAVARQFKKQYKLEIEQVKQLQQGVAEGSNNDYQQGVDDGVEYFLYTDGEGDTIKDVFLQMKRSATDPKSEKYWRGVVDGMKSVQVEEQVEQGVAEVSLGDYRKKATMQKAQSQMGAMFNNDPEKQKQYQDTFNKRDRGLNRLKARDEVARKANADKQMSNNIAKLPELRAEYERMKAEYKALGGSNWQYADRDQNLTDRERKARAMEDPMNNLWRTIQSAEKTQRSADDIAETATPGATSAGNVATLGMNPKLSPGPARGKKSYIGSPGKSGTKAPPQPKVNQPKTKHGTAVNALDMKSNIFGGGKAIKRK